MTDEILSELWKVKDELGQRFEGDLRAYCDYLNRTVSVEGFEVVDRSRSEQVKVAEDSPEYGAGND